MGPNRHDAGGPASPITVLAQGAAATHELFRAYVDAGFTEDQALALIIGTIGQNMRHGDHH